MSTEFSVWCLDKMVTHERRRLLCRDQNSFTMEHVFCVGVFAFMYDGATTWMDCVTLEVLKEICVWCCTQMLSCASEIPLCPVFQSRCRCLIHLACSQPYRGNEVMPFDHRTGPPEAGWNPCLSASSVYCG